VVAGFQFALQAQPTGAAAWTELARRAEGAGFDCLCVADHPGLTMSPFVALAAAAGATTSIGLGTAVLNTGVRHPLDIAADAAALDLLSGGRVVLGLGAGHTPSEWAAAGLPYPTAADRVGRFVEVVDVVQRLLTGETVTFDGRYVRSEGAVLTTPRPHRPVPLLVGGNNRRLTTFGARCADVVELSGLGPTLPDGHRHELRWRPEEIDRSAAAVWAAAAEAARTPVLGALVQHLEVTDDATASAERLRAAVSSWLPSTTPTVEDLSQAPYVLTGPAGAIAEKLTAVRARWGFSRFTVRAPAFDDAAAVIDALG
jgi:probable F420-dependent oxidoreductase